MSFKKLVHLYFGCECVVYPGKMKPFKTHIVGIHTNGNIQVAHAQGSQDMWSSEDIKLLLRPLSDMNEEEAIELCDIHGVALHLMEFTWQELRDALVNEEQPIDESLPDWVINPTGMFQTVQYLLSHCFDLFALIDVGIAEDKTKFMGR